MSLRALIVVATALLVTNGCTTVTSYGRPIDTVQVGDLTTYVGRWNIPQYVKPEPSFETLKHYGEKVKAGERRVLRYSVAPATSPRKLVYAVERHPSLSAVMGTSSILSYQYYDSGVIKYNERSPEERFGYLLPDGDTYHSNSMGKSLVSYVAGHAICEGYIESVNTTLSDWELMKGTVYGDQRLIDLLNMTARDRHVVSDVDGLKASGRWYNTTSLQSLANTELQGTKPSGSKTYHYNGLVTNVIMNYVIHKSDGKFEELLHKIFNEKVAVENEVYFNKLSSSEGWYQFHATPEDYMRVAIAIMEDWQNDTCVGRYLKDIDALRVNKLLKREPDLPKFQTSKSYGGQFHLNFRGMEQRSILGMDGYGGQTILIDMTKSRIVVINTIHTNYDWKKFAVNVIRDGQL